MSAEEMLSIVHGFDANAYMSYLLAKYNLSKWKSSWTSILIIRTLKQAFSKGFVGIHFIPDEYEGCISEILSQYFGQDHYIAYRVCKKHGFIVLEPHFRKLKLNPSDHISSSFKVNKNIHALQENQEYVDFCFE